MKRILLLFAMATAMTATAMPQGKQGELEKVIALLNTKSLTFHSVQTDFISDTFQKAGDEHFNDSGTLYFKRSRKGTEIAIDNNPQKPAHEKVVVKNGAAQINHFNSKSIETHSAGDKREKLEGFLTLGFGGSGNEIMEKFDVKYVGIESVGNRATYKLELTPKSKEAREMFRLIILWIDQETGMSVQQRLLSGLTDYHLATYSNFRINQKLPGNAFELPASKR